MIHVSLFYKIMNILLIVAVIRRGIGEERELSGRGNGIKIATTPYHASSLDLAPQGRARYGVVAI